MKHLGIIYTEVILYFVCYYFGLVVCLLDAWKLIPGKLYLLLDQLVAYNIITTILYDPISYSSGNNKSRGPPAKCNNH